MSCCYFRQLIVHSCFCVLVFRSRCTQTTFTFENNAAADGIDAASEIIADSHSKVFTIGSSETESDSGSERGLSEVGTELELEATEEAPICEVPVKTDTIDVVSSLPNTEGSLDDPTADEEVAKNDGNPASLYMVYELKQQLGALRESFIDRGLRIDGLQKALKHEIAEKVRFIKLMLLVRVMLFNACC